MGRISNAYAESLDFYTKLKPTDRKKVDNLIAQRVVFATMNPRRFVAVPSADKRSFAFAQAQNTEREKVLKANPSVADFGPDTWGGDRQKESIYPRVCCNCSMCGECSHVYCQLIYNTRA